MLMVNHYSNKNDNDHNNDSSDCWEITFFIYPECLLTRLQEIIAHQYSSGLNISLVQKYFCYMNIISSCYFQLSSLFCLFVCLFVCLALNPSSISFLLILISTPLLSFSASLFVFVFALSHNSLYQLRYQTRI